MKELPDNVSPYKRTPEFTESSVPEGLLRAHNTREGVWGEIIVVEGILKYRILEPEFEELQLSSSLSGIVEPQVLHEVEPMGQVKFYVQFYSQIVI